ncbi:DNA-3-methyladenine glycosylase I [Sediminitomix flava]|uniref:DNA-3-methyladenine glycosylase I n=1 Tax=Sediminitomix flava TaxID=379075 RepID=A0A315ZV81_SEDFL|nr:DNA-3-methyladenine glycosylase I [Sediminitomix flava]PWJ40109.1 DNA-3-methyladenine glycosylase I [Sediminitomix flava]
MEPKPKSYCQAVALMKEDDVNRFYHDHEYGFPLESDNELFGRLILEINQAGLSWTTILNKKENFYEAYDQYEIEVVANYSEGDRERLLSDKGIIRNKLKVNAAIHNANVILGLQKEHGSFKNWLDLNHPKTKEEWVKLFKKTFKFTGGEITNEFLMSTGYLKGAHDKDCPVYHEILKLNPKWASE